MVPLKASLKVESNLSLFLSSILLVSFDIMILILGQVKIFGQVHIKEYADC